MNENWQNGYFMLFRNSHPGTKPGVAWGWDHCDEGNTNWVRRGGKRGEPYKLAPPQLAEAAGEGGKLPASHGCHWVRHDYQWLCFWQRWAFRHLLGHQFSDLWGSLDEGEKVRWMLALCEVFYDLLSCSSSASALIANNTTPCVWWW